MVKIRDRQNNYSLLVAVLLIIIMVLISYIAYNFGLNKNHEESKEDIPVIKEEFKINKLFSKKDMCDDTCDMDIININDLKISIKDNDLIFSGSKDKTINLKSFNSLNIIDSYFLVIQDDLENELSNIYLYNIDLDKIDSLEINNTLDPSFNALEMIYYTYDDTCINENKMNYIKNNTLISSKGFNKTTASIGPLKEKGFLC